MAAGQTLMSGLDDPAADRVAGYKQPPRASQFRKGQSGNPRGRPRNRHRDVPYDSLLGQMVTIREDGRERRVTAAGAFLLQLTQKGLAGDSAATRATLAAIEEARSKRPARDDIREIRLVWVGMGASPALAPLNLAVKKYPTDQNRVRWELQPWIVEAALARLGPRRLSLDEQREIWSNKRTPHKVAWPEWWSVKG